MPTSMIFKFSLMKGLELTYLDVIDREYSIPTAQTSMPSM
jgi:hypothetical protein